MPGGPPPGGGYGQPPGGGGFAPPPGGMPQGGGGGSVDVMAAPSWGLKKLQEDMGTWLTLAAIPLIVYVAIQIGGAFVSRGFDSFIVSQAVGGVFSIIGFVIFGLAARGLIRAALGATRGEKPSMEHLTDMTDIGPYLIMSLIISVVAGIGYIFCILPGIAVVVACGFAYTIQLDQKLDPIEAIKQSVAMIQSNPGPAIGGLLLCGLIGQVGIFLCCIGVIFTWPIGWMANVHLYKQLRGEPIAP